LNKDSTIILTNRTIDFRNNYVICKKKEESGEGTVNEKGSKPKGEGEKGAQGEECSREEEYEEMGR